PVTDGILSSAGTFIWIGLSIWCSFTAGDCLRSSWHTVRDYDGSSCVPATTTYLQPRSRYACPFAPSWRAFQSRAYSPSFNCFTGILLSDAGSLPYPASHRLHRSNDMHLFLPSSTAKFSRRNSLSGREITFEAYSPSIRTSNDGCGV